jgi:hypothetical protein
LCDWTPAEQHRGLHILRGGFHTFPSKLL